MEQAAPQGSHPDFLQQQGPEELFPSLPPMAQRAWPDPSLPELPAPLQGDFFSLSSEHRTRIDGSLPNGTRAARSSVRVSMTCGHVTHGGTDGATQPGHALSHLSQQPNPWGASLSPSLPQPWLRVTLCKAPSQGGNAGHRWHSRAPGNGSVLQVSGGVWGHSVTSWTVSSSQVFF